MELLNQGTYGCIYNPGITCNAKPQSPKFTTKIHATKKSGSNEATIGELVRTKIPRYQNYFSPVLETCPVNLAKVNKDDVDQCEFIHKDILSNKSLTYQSSKLKYIEGTTLSDFLATHPTSIIAEHLLKVLLTSVKKLATIGIVHYDLKENNVIVKKNGTPIIIDFGISLNMNDLDGSLTDMFYAYAPDYTPWCPEIHIICYFVNHPNVKKATYKKFEEIMDKSSQIPYIDTQSKYQKLAKKLDGMSSTQIIKELLKTYKTWDTYAVAIMIAQAMQQNNIEPSPKLLEKLRELTD